MTARNILIGLGAGLAAALLYAGLLTGTVIALPLFIISPLPIAIAGLGFGTLAGALAAATASALLALAIHPIWGILYLVNYGAPTAWVAHLVGLSRPSDTSPDEREWFPLDAVLLRAALASAVSVVIWIVMRGFDASAWSSDLVDAMMNIMTDGGSGPARAEVEPIVRIVVAMLPFLFTLFVLVALIFNVYLGARIVRKSGLMQRPWIALWQVRLPRVVVPFLALTLIAAFAGGTIGDVGGAFAGALGGAFMLTGYGLVHATLQGRAAKGGLLWLLYTLTFFFSPTLAVMGIAGVADSLFDLRSRHLGGPVDPN